MAEVCGIQGADGVPSEPIMSRFFAKLATRKYLHLVKNVSRRLMRKHYEILPGFGQRVAIDSTTLKAWSNGGKIFKTGKHSDPDARSSVKTNTHGRNEYTFGYKLHLMVDCEYEPPMAANVTPGNAHDGRRASNLLAEARFTNSKFHPRFPLADAGYSGKELSQPIKRQYRAVPVIQLNPRHTRLRETMTYLNKVVARQRQSVERAFSRLKGQRALNRITVRRKIKVTAYAYLSLKALQAVVQQ